MWFMPFPMPTWPVFRPSMMLASTTAGLFFLSPLEGPGQYLQRCLLGRVDMTVANFRFLIYLTCFFFFLFSLSLSTSPFPPISSSWTWTTDILRTYFLFTEHKNSFHRCAGQGSDCWEFPMSQISQFIKSDHSVIISLSLSFSAVFSFRFECLITK